MEGTRRIIKEDEDEKEKERKNTRSSIQEVMLLREEEMGRRK